MSKKGKKGKIMCLACGGRMRGKDAACRKCGQANPAVSKAAGAPLFLAKSAGNVVPFLAKSQRPWCVRGCGRGAAGARHCTRCGTLLQGMPARHGVAKAAAAESPWAAAWRRETDPDRAETMWYLMHPELKKPGGGAA